MLPFIQLLKLLLTLEYPDGVDPHDLHREFLDEFEYTDIEIGLLELAGAGFVDIRVHHVRATAALYEDERDQYLTKLYKSIDPLERNFIEGRLALLE